MDSGNYTDYCALTDLDLRLKAEYGWHPSYLTAYDPREKQTRVLLFRPFKDCAMNTNVSLTADKQRIVCEGGKKSVCGSRNLPARGQPSSPLILKSVNFDPVGPDYWQCGDNELQNTYSFKGSYYYAYVKLATCDIPRGM